MAEQCEKPASVLAGAGEYHASHASVGYKKEKRK